MVQKVRFRALFLKKKFVLYFIIIPLNIEGIVPCCCSHAHEISLTKGVVDKRKIIQSFTPDDPWKKPEHIILDLKNLAPSSYDMMSPSQGLNGMSEFFFPFLFIVFSLFSFL